MTELRPPLIRAALTSFAVLAEAADLLWEYFHGGVVTHHVLHRADMPGISNWWGALVVPVLAWFLSGRIQKRVEAASAAEGETRIVSQIATAFVGAILYGALLSFAFITGRGSVASALFLGMLLLATILPLYRAEYVLGFVLGMLLTFGAVLPSVVGSVIAAWSALVHFCTRFFGKRFRRSLPIRP